MLTILKLLMEFSMVFNLSTSHIEVELVTPESLPYIMNFHTNSTRRAHGIAFPSKGQIKINKEHWRVISLVEKRELIYHEVAHLISPMDHQYDLSIMNPFNDSKHGYAIMTGKITWLELVRKLKIRLKNK